MVVTDRGTAQDTVQPQVKGLPVWYFALAGLLVASFDISAQFRSAYPLVAALPLVLVAVHIGLLLTVFSRRRQYLRSVWRSPRARLLAIGLFGVRLLLQQVLTRVTDAAAPLHTYAHLIMGLTLLVPTMALAWFDQWLILRTLNKHPTGHKHEKERHP